MNSKKLWSTMLSLVATVIVLFALGGMTVLADETDGSEPYIIDCGCCGGEGNGENLSWTLDSNGLLTISGAGEMADYGENNSPWENNRNDIKAANISEGVTSIGNYAFNRFSVLASVTIPDSVTSIGNYAFNSCSVLASVTIPDSVTSFGDNTFENCISLTSITISDSVTSIGNYAFNECTSLTSITIPDSVTTIGNSAFNECTSLTSITISDSVTSIGDYAFCECESLTSITIPDSVTSIGDSAFCECYALTSVTIPDSVTSISVGVFYYCTSLTSIAIPNSVTSIGAYAFEGCTSLTSIAIPNSVTSIGVEAFGYCASLTSIAIPNSVTSIGNKAFYNCWKIIVISLKVAPGIVSNNLSSIFPSSINAVVSVPGEYYDAYESLFSSFKNITLVNGDYIFLGSCVHLYGYSLSLDGSIGVNFYMKLSETVLNNEESAYMEFTVNEKTQQVPVKDATIKDGYYIFRCDVVAKEMADKITAQVYLSEGNPIGDAYTYSVQEYAAYIIDHPERFPAGAVDLVKAMLNYGAASQKYFKYNTYYLANSILPLGEQQSALSSGNLTYYNAGDISPEKISLSLKSTITLKLYFKTDDLKIDELNSVTSFKCTKYQLTTTVSGEYTIVIIEGIRATDFSGIISIKCYLNGGNDYKTVKIRPSNYAYIALNQPVGGVITDDLKEVVRALYIFSVAANEYNSVLPA